MKNNKAFTLMELLAVVVVLAIIGGVTAITLTSVINKGKDNVYVDYEATLKTTVENYFVNQMFDSGISLSVGSSKTITLEELIQERLITNLKDPNGDYCDSVNSYVKVVREADKGINYNLTYEVCLVCSNYQSSNC